MIGRQPSFLRKLAVLASACLAACLLSPPARAQGTVELEVVMESGVPATDGHRWMQMLGEAGLDRVRIVAGGANARPDIRSQGEGDRATHVVTGVLTRGGVLKVPGKQFRLGDTQAVRDWSATVGRGGQAALAERPAAFGLLGPQLVEVHRQLGGRIDFSTQGMKAAEAAQKIAEKLTVRVEFDAAARQAMHDDDYELRDDLLGLSHGTALAAALRPLGLVLVPRPQGRDAFTLLVTAAQNAPESWPIGWPPAKPLGETLPKMLDMLPVEIEDIPLTEALTALGKRVEVPLLYDYNAMARHRIEPSEVRVSFPKSRTHYKRVFDRLTFQGGLKVEVRVDEAEQPFLWITTQKK